MGGLGLGGTDLSLSNSSSARSDNKAAQLGSMGSFGPRGNYIGQVGGIGSSAGISTTTLAIAVAAVVAAFWYFTRK